MASLLDMNRQEKEQYVIQLYKEDRSTREIAKLTHIHESEETMAQKRAEMAYLNRECRKLRQRIIDYSSHHLRPIVHFEPDANSDSTQIVPYKKE